MTEKREITTPEALAADAVPETSLRPQCLEDFIGQDKVRDTLSIAIQQPNKEVSP